MKKIKRIGLYSLITLLGLAICLKIYFETGNYMYHQQLAHRQAADTIQAVHTLVTHRTLVQNGYSIHYFVSGNPTAEALVFLHPAFADHRCFDAQIDFFAKDYHVIAIDMLGHGLSQVEKSHDKIDATARHILAILQQEGHSSAHLAGVSVGSLLAQYFAFLYPEQTQSVTVVGGYDIHQDNTAIQKAQRKEQFSWILKALFSMNAFRRHVASVSVATPAAQDRFYTMAQLYTRTSFSSMTGLSQVIRFRPTAERHYPLLILVGAQDIELSRQQAAAFHAHTPNSIFKTVENAGHCINMDQPDAFNALLHAFLPDSK